MNADKVKVGGYQVLTLLLLCVNLVIVGMSHALSIFYKYKPEFHCEDDVSNDTSVCPPTSCPNGSIVFNEINRTSVATEWQLICDREYLLRTIGDVYFGGMLLGGIVAGLLMDRIGRMPILAVCLYAQGTMAVAMNIVEHYQLFLLFRGLQGFFMQGLESSTYILGIELFPSKYRTFISLIILSMRSVGFATLAGLSYVVLDWRVLQLVVSVPTALTVLYIWLIPESVRWLLARERSTDAEMVIERIAYYNNLFSRKRTFKETPEKPKRKTNCDECDVGKSAEAENLLEEVKADEGKTDLDADEIAVTDEITNFDETNQPNQSYISVSKETLSTEEIDGKGDEKNVWRSISKFFETRFLGRTCLVLICLWFTCSVAFHGLITLPHKIKLDIHVSLAIGGLMEIVTFLFGYLLISSRCGRRVPFCISQIVTGTVCVALVILAFSHPEQVSATEWIGQSKAAILKIGAIANVISFFILRILTIELFPTISRGTGLGLCIGAEMFGGLITPFILKLNNYLTDKKLDVSRISIGLFCICMAFLTVILSETVRLRTLPDAVEDAKMLDEKYKNGKNNDENMDNEQSENPEKLRKKLFSEDWVDAGNGIIVNFTENKTVD